MAKGSQFEREFCDTLSEWWTGEKGRRIFWRSSNSGGMATARNKKGKRTKQHCGDVCAIDPIGFPLTDLITFEIKRGYSKHTIADLLDKPEGAAKQMYDKWIDQARKARDIAGTPYWMLVVKRDHRKPLIFTEEDLFDIHWFPYRFRIELPFLTLLGTTLGDFFAEFSPKDAHKLGYKLEGVSDVR